MKAPEHFTNKDMVFRTLDNVAKTLRDEADLNAVRVLLQRAIEAASSWEDTLMNVPELSEETQLAACSVCGAKVDWCECGKCHQIHCKACGLIVDNVRVGNEAETLDDLRAAMRDWWNGRTDSPRLVSYAPNGSTCTLNIDGEEHYYDRVGTTAIGTGE